MFFLIISNVTKCNCMQIVTISSLFLQIKIIASKIGHQSWKCNDLLILKLFSGFKHIFPNTVKKWRKE